MSPPPAKASAPRRRNRKRKRRVASSSESSSSDSSSDSDSPAPQVVKKVTVQAPPEESSSSDSSSDSDSDSDSETKPIKSAGPSHIPVAVTSQRRSRSPTPPPSAIPSFIPSKEKDDSQNEQVLKDRFRKFWMSSVADSFKDDLEEIRKEPNLTTSRLALLIDSLAAGGEVFSSKVDNNDMSEMDIVMEHYT